MTLAANRTQTRQQATKAKRSKTSKGRRRSPGSKYSKAGPVIAEFSPKEAQGFWQRHRPEGYGMHPVVPREGGVWLGAVRAATDPGWRGWWFSAPISPRLDLGRLLPAPNWETNQPLSLEAFVENSKG